MLESIKYINHQNEIIEFGKDVIFANYNDLRDYAWEYDLEFEQLTNFRRAFSDKSLPIVINATNHIEGLKLKNKVFEIFEKDVLSNEKGKFVVGDYYFKCFVVASVNNSYLSSKRVLEKLVTIVTDEPYWIKENKYLFRSDFKQDSKSVSFYDYDYPYAYSNNLGIRDIVNSHFVDCNISITIFGPAVNPTIYIKGNQYKVNTELLKGEYLTIDSRDKTVIKTKNNGEKINEFHKRDREYSVFKKIEPGNSFVSWDESFEFEIIIKEESSEPRWI